MGNTHHPDSIELPRKEATARFDGDRWFGMPTNPELTKVQRLAALAKEMNEARGTERRSTDVEDSLQALDALFQSAAKAAPANGYLDFLEFVVRFKRYSAYNVMMIYAQRRGATAVGTRLQWKRIGRRVSPDAVPIVILKTFGPIDFVYELGDTAGRPVPGEGSDPFQATGRIRRDAWKRATAAAQDCAIAVELTDAYGMGLAGTAAQLALDDANEMQIETVGEPGSERRRPKTGVPVLWRIRINRNHSPETQYATLAHELGHVYCGHLGRGPYGLWPDRRGSLSHEQREIEAEAVSYLAARRAGLETRSADYLHRFISPDNLAKISPSAILRAVGRVEDKR